MHLKKNIVYAVYQIILISLFSSCDPVGGAGKIKGYQYPVTKKALQNAIELTIENNSSKIHKDTIRNHYNNDLNYYTIYIGKDEFVIGYLGNSEYWDTSKTSEIAIVYAFDENDKGGSDGHGDFRWKGKLKKKLINIFEKEFINKLDSVLGQKHIDQYN